MNIIFRYILVLIVLVFASETMMAQDIKIRETHKVKRKETIFGIAKSYGITIEELMAANPEMRTPGYELKRGMRLSIPYKQIIEVKKDTVKVEKPVEVKPQKSDVRRREVRIGIMLPFENKTHGGRMVEYYRGVLMACDSLKLDGVSIDIHAWNVDQSTNINTILAEESAKKCDLIIGPFHSKHVKPLADFAIENDVKVLLPFQIDTKEVLTCSNLFQAYQNPGSFNTNVISKFLDKFSNYHVVFIDCNDATSNKGAFTKEMRTRLEGLHRSYNITNLNSQEADFRKAFSLTMPNVVVLNSPRSPQLNIAFAKLNTLILNQKDLRISTFGYPEWMAYTTFSLDNFYKFDTYIPSSFYLNPLSSRTARIQQKYRWNFHSEMDDILPRYAITGFDHAYYFIKGLKLYGSSFSGHYGAVGYTPIQTPLGFEKYEEGGMYNKSILFVHYTQGHRIETINY